MKWSVVVPTNRPEKFKEFYAAWEPLFMDHDVTLYIIEDGPSKSDFEINIDYEHYCWEDKIPSFIPQRTDMIRSYGFYKVYQDNLELMKEGVECYTLTLDDDVLPIGDPIAEYEEVFKNGSVFSEFLSVGAMTSSGLEMRGFPYQDRKRAEVAVQYGGWRGVLDYDAATQLAVPKKDETFMDIVMPVPTGAAATCCIMNTAFNTAYTPIMWQLPMLDGRYNRVGDIWSGLFIKKTIDQLGVVMVINGKASVEHRRASDPYNSLKKEAPSVDINDELWYSLNKPSQHTLIATYRQVTNDAIEFFKEYDEEYANHFKVARDKWLNLFK